MSRATLLFCAGTLALAAPALAQCPDGTPPPCAGARNADPLRIAILPFHVTTADTLLGEGLAELLAGVFTAEGGPRAVHMGTVLRAWRGAGGSLRAPLAQAQAERLARGVGASQYVEGSVVGLATRITLSANVRRPSGRSVRAVGPFSGPADSLEALVGQLASGLVAASGTELRVDTRSRLTGSPAAMRAYLAGLREARRGRSEQAAREFDRALGLDSAFARAALMRHLATLWYDPYRLEPHARRAWSLRDRLSPQDRLLLVAFLGEHYPAERSPAEHLADRERAAAQLPESPEAQYELGDYFYHAGGASGVPNQVERARAAFERSLALDTQATVLRHLIDVALHLGDTALLRGSARTLDVIAPHSPFQWVVAAATDDRARTAAAMPDAEVGDLAEWLVNLDGAITPDKLVALYRVLAPSTPPDWGVYLPYVLQFSHAIRGRQAPLDYVPATSVVASALYADGDSAAGAAAAARLATDTLPWAWSAACMRGHWKVRHGGSITPEEAAYLRANQQALCAQIIELLQAVRDRAPDVERRLTAADSVVRHNVANVKELFGFENLILARIWEARGDKARALSALRVRDFGRCCHWTVATGSREEGRLAAQLGDTTGAIRAYRRYLSLWRDPRPALVPQRDSMRAELARLERR